jgi:hypothetical protein
MAAVYPAQPVPMMMTFSMTWLRAAVAGSIPSLRAWAVNNGLHCGAYPRDCRAHDT